MELINTQRTSGQKGQDLEMVYKVTTCLPWIHSFTYH